MKSENKIQTQVATYIRLQYPDVIFTSESSGIRVTMGVAKQMKAQRSSHKLPDLIILEPKEMWHGLILELKKSKEEYLTKDGRCRENEHIQEQLLTLVSLQNKGYYARFAGGFDEAKSIIDWYMQIKKHDV